MIEQIQFTNFMALKEVSLPLGRLTVLVGPNASGKTSILRGLKQFAEQQLPPEFLRQGTTLFSVTGQGTSENKPWMLKYTHANSIESRGWSGDLVKMGNTLAPPLVLYRTLLLRLDRDSLAKPSSGEDSSGMSPEGLGLASLLEELKLTHDERFDGVIAALKAIVPHFEGLRLPKEQITKEVIETLEVNGTQIPRTIERKYWGRRIVFDLKGAPGISADMVSEGTLLTLGLLAVLYQPTPPSLLLLDDIDRGLHPKAQGELIAQLRKLLELHPELQIVATSHSPYLLDHLQFEEIRIGTIDDDGSALWASMKDHPRFEEWKTLMSPGELWSNAGEAWINSLPQRT